MKSSLKTDPQLLQDGAPMRSKSLLKSFVLACCYLVATALWIGDSSWLGDARWGGCGRAVGQEASTTPTATTISTPPQSSEDLLEKEQQAFQQAAAMAAPAVVQIETFGGLERVGDELVAEGPTTGTILTHDGWIVSSLFSFRQQPASILVTLPSGERVPARIVARDTSRELALLKVDGQSDLPFARPPETDPQPLGTIGAWVIALGKTYDANFPSQSVGIISAMDRAYGKAIQTDAKISPVNYGGPLVDLSGRTLGILAPVSPGAFFDGDSTQLYDSGIGFAIPMADILDRLPVMQKGQDIHPGKLGIVTDDSNDLAGPVSVVGAMPGSPAAKAGLQAGDIVIEMDGQRVQRLSHLRHALGRLDAGRECQITVLRDKKRIETSAELVAEVPTYRRRFLGLRVREVEMPAGFEVLGIEPDSPAQDSSLQVGYRIQTVNGRQLDSLKDFRQVVAVAELDTPLKLAGVDTSGEEFSLALTAATWPNQLPTSLPDPDERLQDAMQTTTVAINLGDFPNRAYAIVPPLADERELGLLIVFPEPGELTQSKAEAHWGEFARQYGWIVAVINSGNQKRWSMEEVALTGRVIGRMQKGYRIDQARTVLAGLGVGGRVALIASTTERERVSAVVAVGADLRGLQVRRGNAPMQSLEFLFVGKDETLEEPASELSDLGFGAIVLSAAAVDPQKLETLPQQQIERWLEGLGRL